MKTIDNDIKFGNIKRAYLLYGEERYLLRQYKEKLKRAIVDESDSMNFSSFEGENLNEKEIIDLAETLPFFADRRLIMIEGSGLFKKGGEDLATYLPESPETTYFLFVEEEVDKRSKMYKALGKVGSAIEFVQQTDETLMKWITSRIKKEGKNISQNAYQLFVEKTGADMENIDKELEKLLCYTLERDTITLEDVEAVTTEQIQNKIFEMVEAIVNKNQKKALDLYYDLLALKEPPMRIMFLITSQFQNLMIVKAMTVKGYPPKEIASKIGKQEWLVKKYQAQCRNYQVSDLKKIVQKGVEFEESVKTGQMNDQMAVELFMH